MALKAKKMNRLAWFAAVLVLFAFGMAYAAEETVEEIPYGEWRPLPERGVLCIDTGCGKGGRLTAMVVSRRTEGRFFCLVHPMSGWVPS